LQAKVGTGGQVVGVDFSPGMLKMAHKKIMSLANVSLVQADAGCLPFASETFDAVTCSHAFYALKGETQKRALQEIVRVLRPEGAFLMMEHDVPSNRFVKILFYFRLTFIGAGRAMAFLRHEQEVLASYFGSVEKLVSPAGRSKIMVCRKGNTQKVNNLTGSSDGKSHVGLVCQLLKKIPIKDSIGNKPHAFTHHVEENVLSLRAYGDDVS
jgi:SAM-dependent methyltransferase